MEPIEAIREVLESEEAIRFALLFGSRAAGTARPDSDWDLAVFLDPALSPQERFRIRRRLLADLPPDTDLVDLAEAPPLLAHRALQGRRLVDRDPVAWVRFFVRTLARSQDEAYWRRIHRGARRQRLREGRFGRP